MGEAVELMAHGFHYGRVTVAGIHHPDSAAEVDQAIPVRICDNGTIGVDDRDWRDGRDASGHGLGASLEERAAIRARNLRDKLDDARHLHPEGKNFDVKGWTLAC
jgi:hypothetical protein